MLLNWRLHELFSSLFYVNYRHYLVRHRLLGGSPKISLFYIEIMNSTLIHYLKSSAWIRNLTLFNDIAWPFISLFLRELYASICYVLPPSDSIERHGFINYFNFLLLFTWYYSLYNYNGFYKQIFVFVLLTLESKALFFSMYDGHTNKVKDALYRRTCLTFFARNLRFNRK